jgi:hypothetical protein
VPRVRKAVWRARSGALLHSIYTSHSMMEGIKP